MSKVIDVCTRVEGHGTVNIFVQKDELKHIEFELSGYRGFESILLNKKLLDVPRIISRVCGICHASHMIVSCKAIENMYGVQISDQSENLRRLMLIGELIKSHTMHFFLQSLPDLLQIFGIQKTAPNPYELINFDKQLTTHLFDLIKIGNDIDRVFGGKSIHMITPVPGGVIYPPSKKNITLAKNAVKNAVNHLGDIIDKFVHLFSEHAPPEEYELPKPIFLAMHNKERRDRYAGMLRLKQLKTKPIDFQEKHYSTYFDKESNLRGIDLKFENSNNLLVGPISRNEIVENGKSEEISTWLSYFEKDWKNSVLYANLLRLIEMYAEAQQGQIILEENPLDKRETLPKLSSLKSKDGVGAIEAPRGLLLHSYSASEESTIKEVKLFIATEFNLPIINSMITSYGQKLYEKSGDPNEVKKKVQTVIRAFDPCISCATH